MGIYCITNSANGKSYIGKSNDIDRRRTQHFSALGNNEHDNEEMQKDYNKYGNDCFEFSVLETVEDEYKLDYIEDYYIKKFDSFVNGYNRCRGNIKSVLSTDSFSRKPTFEKGYFTCEKITNDGEKYSLQDFFLFHNRNFSEIDIEGYLKMYANENTNFYVKTKNSFTNISRKDIFDYFTLYEIFTTNLKVSDQFMTYAHRLFDEGQDLLNKWDKYIEDRIEYINSCESVLELKKYISKGNDIIEKIIELIKRGNGHFSERCEEVFDHEISVYIKNTRGFDDYFLLRYENSEFEDIKECI